MASGRSIKGITVEIGGDTTKLTSALSGVNKEIKNTQSQLKDVEKLLKLEPSNTELLAQKQKLLSQAVNETKEKLTTLKTVAQQANEQLQRGEITQEQYDALQREIEETEQSLRNLEPQAALANSALAKIDEVGGKFQQAGEKIAGVGKTLTATVTAPIVGLGAAAAKTAADFDSQMSRVAANPNTNVSMMGETFKYCAPIAGAFGFSMEDTAEAIGLMANAGIKSTQAGTALYTIMNNLAGEAKFCGKNIGEVTVVTTNADGSTRHLSDLLADCRVAFSGLSESEKANAAKALLSKNAISGFLAPMNAAPADIDKHFAAIDNYCGVSDKMAAAMRNNMSGQLTILKSQLKELAISFGELLMLVFRSIVSKAQELVDKRDAIDEEH